MTLFYAIIRFIVNIVHIMFPVKVFGNKKFEKNKRLVIIANHISGWDPVIFVANFYPTIHTLYKSELDNNIIFRTVFRGMGSIPVQRGENDINATKKCIKYLKNDEIIYLYPEGTRNKTQEKLLPLKNGAALLALRTQSPIQISCVQKKYKFFQKNYIFIGPQLDFSKYFDVKITREILEEVTQILTDEMLKAQYKLDEMVLNLKKKKVKQI